ncbi:Bifunctional adenosylcobalamin biosynthesis protein CobP [Clostridium neonatale]|nr:Bifunctional adenosylcobalamin biosynthesis protein CobP [Clostridium neonatale]
MMKSFFVGKDNIEKLNFNKKVICGLHIFVKECVKNNISALDIIKNNADNLNDKIIICDEINSGIVPMKKEDRMWREECGQSLQFLSKHSEEVYRVFFGIPEKLK